MALVETAPHEVEGNLVYVEHGLRPYWTFSRLLHQGLDNYVQEVPVHVDGEQWEVMAKFSKSGLKPRPEDSVDPPLNEYEIKARGQGERHVTFQLKPRFQDMESLDGESVSTPFDHEGPDEGVNVQFHGSNIEPDEYPGLLWEFVQGLADEAEMPVSGSYFMAPHDWSNLFTYERYVRVNRSTSKKYIRNDGIMRRLLMLCADEKGSQAELKIDNEEIVGYNHRLVLPQQDAARLAPTHSLGKQIKHYHPKHVRGGEEDDDPLYHPKIGALAKKSLNNIAFNWADRDEVRRELDEVLLSTLRWSGITVDPGGTTFVADDHFDPVATDQDLSLYDDPTPEIEAEQDAMIVRALTQATDADLDLVETLVADGDGQHYHDITDATGRAVSTIYRALNRLGELVESDDGEIRFGSRKLAQDIAEIIETTEHQLRSAAGRVAQLVMQDDRRAESSAFQEWLNEYAVEVMESIGGEGPGKLRIATTLSTLKSTSHPHIEDVLAEGYGAWVRDGRDPAAFLRLLIQWSDRGDVRSSMPGAYLDA